MIFVALVRGINLGARNRLAMADLRRVVEEAGGVEVRTHLQSGNAVFRSSAGGAKLEHALAKGLHALGLDVAVIVRSARQMVQIKTGNPFPAASSHVTFLAAKPAAARIRSFEAGDYGPDDLRVTSGAVYLHCPKGYGRSKLSNAFIERQLGVAATTRNWRTVAALADLAAS